MGLHLSELELQNILKKGHVKIANAGDNVQPPAANVERNPGNEIKKPYANEAFDKRVIITVHSYRYRLADPDGLCAKYHIDSIVNSGLLVDDKASCVEEVRFKQSKIKKPEAERTVVTLQEINQNKT